MSTLDELLSEFEHLRALGKRVSYPEAIAAILTLEPRQAEAMCLTLWALPPDVVSYLVREGRAEALAKREGYPLRAAARQMGINHVAVSRLVERAKPNILAAILTSDVS